MKERLKRKYNWAARIKHTHEDYFMTDEEYNWQLFCDANKESFEAFNAAMADVINCLPTAQEFCDMMVKAFNPITVLLPPTEKELARQRSREDLKAKQRSIRRGGSAYRRQ